MAPTPVWPVPVGKGIEGFHLHVPDCASSPNKSEEGEDIIAITDEGEKSEDKQICKYPIHIFTCLGLKF